MSELPGKGNQYKPAEAVYILDDRSELTINTLYPNSIYKGIMVGKCILIIFPWKYDMAGGQVLHFEILNLLLIVY